LATKWIWFDMPGLLAVRFDDGRLKSALYGRISATQHFLEHDQLTRNSHGQIAHAIKVSQ
jgi:hypothetical protein